jgi:predicted Zn-ribbon and HTH transcriptional regulator
VAAFLFGDGVKAKDIMTAEQVIRQIRKRADKTLVLDDAAKSIKDAGFDIPKEMIREI